MKQAVKAFFSGMQVKTLIVGAILATIVFGLIQAWPGIASVPGAIKRAYAVDKYLSEVIAKTADGKEVNRAMVIDAIIAQALQQQQEKK